jgi:hypothetical protein
MAPLPWIFSDVAEASASCADKISFAIDSDQCMITRRVPIDFDQGMMRLCARIMPYKMGGHKTGGHCVVIVLSGPQIGGFGIQQTCRRMM